MSIDVIERRRVVEERLRRARNLTQAIEQATAELTADSGMTIEDLDPDSSLRTAISALAGVAALRPGFDVVVALPDSPLALRVRHLADDVDITLVPNGAVPAADTGPAETGASPETTGTGQVASDLAAMLWHEVSPPP